jgi:hypothetical protein
VWSASWTTTSNIQFRLINLSYNGVQSAGATLTGVGFNAYFNSSANPVPAVTSILFKGVNICSTGKITENVIDSILGFKKSLFLLFFTKFPRLRLNQGHQLLLGH